MSIEAEVVQALRRRGWTLGIAESLTGGAVASAIVTVAGASAVLNGAVVAYATPVKHSLLGVSPELLASYGPVHPMVAEQMAAGVRSAVAVAGRRADIGVSTTGIAGPASPDGQPVGTVHIGISTPTETRSFAFSFDGDREDIRRAAVDAALTAVRDAVRE